MKWVLIMWVYAGAGSGGVSLQQIPFDNESLCESAMTKIEEEAKSAWTPPHLYCVQVKP